jgi:predicted nucleotide-binding protein
VIELDDRPQVFIASSKEGLGIAENLAHVLTRDREKRCTVTLWTDIFWPGKMTLHALVEASKVADVAIMIMAPDDQVTKRDVTYKGARDNVLFEAGLFMGKLAPERLILLRIKDAKPSDDKSSLSDLQGFQVVSLDCVFRLGRTL